MLSISQIRTGKIILLDGDPYVVLKDVFAKQARGAGVMKTIVRNLKTGSTINKSFQGNDKVEEADVGFQKCQYMYNDGENYFFMNNESFEQFELSKEMLGDQIYFLLDGTDVDIRFFESQPISVNLPPKVVLEVADTDPGVRGDTASGGSKPATLETGLVLQVPLFVKIGDKLRVNTDTQEYVERAN
ncbi:elongation factor P [Candidatus Peregrinibacteria bacterium]|nr:elongation factor P [Candidatus Peregrinibacteria bacterium]